MKISPNITLHLAKSQLAARAVPRILRFAASVFWLYASVPKDCLFAQNRSRTSLFLLPASVSTNKRSSRAAASLKSEEVVIVNLRLQTSYIDCHSYSMTARGGNAYDVGACVPS